MRLLQLLRPAPHAWVLRAKRISLGSRVDERPFAVGSELKDGDVARLRQALETDAAFRTRFDVDPIAAARTVGLDELARGLERELRELIAFAERIAADEGDRAHLEADPAAALATAGLPDVIAEPLLEAIAAPDDVLAKLPEVVAHRQEQLSLRARMLLLLLGSTSVTKKLRALAAQGS